MGNRLHHNTSCPAIVLLLAATAWITSCTQRPPSVDAHPDFDGDGIVDQIHLRETKSTSAEFESILVIHVSSHPHVNALEIHHSERFPGMMEATYIDADREGNDNLVVATYEAGVSHSFLALKTFQYDPSRKTMVLQAISHHRDANMHDVLQRHAQLRPVP
jgi:hypothetical protein